ncbi:putative tandem protein 16 [Amphidinium carterae]
MHSLPIANPVQDSVQARGKACIDEEWKAPRMAESNRIRKELNAESLPPAYEPSVKHCPVLTVELDVSRAPALAQVGEEAFQKAAETITGKVGAVKRGDLVVETVVLPEVDFNIVHSMEVSQTWSRVPMVVQCVLGSFRGLFLKVTTCLVNYDGVTALHTLFNVAELLEQDFCGKKVNLSVPAFKFANRRVDFDEKKMAAHQEHLARLRSEDCACDERTLEHGLPPRPSRAGFEEQLPPRVYTRISNSMTLHRQALGIMSEVMERLKLSHVATTVNYSPEGALSRLTCIMDVVDREKRLNGVFTPIRHPPPMGVSHAEQLSYMFFVNNYGKHNPNLSLLEVKGVSWNWTGFTRCFTPFLWFATIQGRLFYLTSFAEPDQRKCHDILVKIQGYQQHLIECAQPRFVDKCAIAGA